MSEQKPMTTKEALRSPEMPDGTALEAEEKAWLSSLSAASFNRYSVGSTTMEVSDALKRIYDRRYYKTISGFDNFYIYCMRKFGFPPSKVDYYLNYTPNHSQAALSSKPSSEKNQEPSFVYFIDAGTLIKIGVTKNIERRFATLRTASPVQITLIGFIAGTEQKEKELHERFSSCRSHGEWFIKNDDLMNHIKEACHE
jgi:hypothetical protein